MSDIRIETNQQSPSLSSEGGIRLARGLRTGEIGVAGLIDMWLAEGRLFEMTVGTVTAGGDVSLITGGGNGTTIDQDQPEFGVSVPNGTILVPVQIDIACQVDLDADAEVGNIVVTYDAAAAYAGDGTVTSETPLNMLSGGGQTTVATAFSAATGDITDPTVSGVLAYKTVRAALFADTTASNSSNAVSLDLNWSAKRDVPVFIQGPGAFYGYWGGTAAVTGLARVVWAEVPEGRFTF